MRKQNPISPSFVRLFAVFGGVLLTLATLVLAARALGSSGGVPGIVLSVISGLAATLIFSSLGEWVVHGKLMHWRTRLPPFRLAYELHHRAHHWLHYRPDGYLKDKVTYVSVVPPQPEHASLSRIAATSAILGQVVFYTAFAMPAILAVCYYTRNIAFSAAFVTGSAVVITLAIHLHDAMHCPGYSRFERFRWFWWLDRHHYIHHIDTRANVNFLLPLGDLLLGTLRRNLTEAELAQWPSYEDARRFVLPVQ
jgi:hypothetical protein